MWPKTIFSKIMAKQQITAILFDLDNTLYPLSVGLTKAIDKRMTAYV